MESFQTVFRIEKSIAITADPKGSAIVKSKSLNIGGKKGEVL